MTARLAAARWVPPVVFVVAVLVVWQLAGLAGALPTYLLSPAAILAGTAELVADGELLVALWHSLRRAAAGLAIGATAGVVAGLLAGVVRPAEDVLDTAVSATYPLPKIALFPVLVVWLGFSDWARVLTIATSCFYPAFVNAFAGTRGIDPRLLWVARNVEAGRWRSFWHVVFRAAMPSIAVGVRISVALAFVLTYATESIGASRDGLGNLIEDGFDNLLYAQMYAGVLAFAVLGIVADQLWARASSRLLHGQRAVALGKA